MSKKSDWRCRRAELVKIVEKYIHGPKPGKPDMVTGTVSSTAIKVHVETRRQEHRLQRLGQLADRHDRTRSDHHRDGRVQPGLHHRQGRRRRHRHLRPPTRSRARRSRSGKFTTIYGSTGASAQVGWAWGISRVIDVLVAEKAAGRNNIIDPAGVGITGCSRNGKARVHRRRVGRAHRARHSAGVRHGRRLRVPRREHRAEGTERDAGPVARFGLDRGAGLVRNRRSAPTGRAKVNTIPGDTSSLVAMYAPRGLLVLDNSRIGELCSTCQHAASVAGQKVYEALGVGKQHRLQRRQPDRSAQPLHVLRGDAGRATEARHPSAPDQEGRPGWPHGTAAGRHRRPDQVGSLDGADAHRRRELGVAAADQVTTAASRGARIA